MKETRSIRICTTLCALTVLQATLHPSTAQVVINEIHFDPDLKTEHVEFVELHNAGTASQDLSGWRLSGGIDYLFPGGTALPAGGYLLIAQDPAALFAKYSATALGPWSGKLNNDGDEIELSNALGSQMDEVEYQLGFPWPTVGDAPGNSIELIHPSFDNDLAGNWRSSLSGPTPGALNSVHATNAPPRIRQVEHDPEQPMSSQPVLFTAKVTDPDGVASVSLHIQICDPGSYIALGDPLYADNWGSVPMNDSGAGGDALAGDSIYSIELPAGLQLHRRLVRYRISASDTTGRSIQVPYADDPQPNFAYFVYDGIPAWQGAIRPGSTSAETFGTNIMRRIPAVHLISKNSDVETATWFERYDGDLYKWQGTLVYDGRVYDHIRYRARGGNWRYAMVKNMWKFDFNRGHDFRMRDNYGRRYDTRWTKLNLGANIQQGNFWHRGEQGLFESVGSRLFSLAGVPSFNTAYLQLRIIDSAPEAPADQYEGDFWGLYLAQEQEDGRFLEERGLPDGNLYKMESGTGELNNLGPDGPTDKSDLNYILNTYSSASDAWWEANWNLDPYYSYQTIVQAIHHYDINAGKNFSYYRNPETGRWTVIPWDLDLTWADNMYDPDWGGLNALASRILGAGASGGNLTLPGTTRTAFRTAFRNRIREIRDLLFNAEQAGQLIDEQAALVRDPGGGLSILDADRAKWDYNPRMDSSTYSSALSKAGSGRFYQWPLEPEVSNDFEGGVQLMKNYVSERGAILDSLAYDAAIPVTPTISYTGVAGFPVNALTFQCSAFSDPQGTGTFAALQWRAGEIPDPAAPAYDPTKPPPYEITAVWQSAVLTNFSNTLSLPPDALKVGHAYRVRVRMKDSSGRWSHWSAPAEFITTESSAAAALTAYLRISELMYRPTGGSGHEFIELQNTSTDQTLDLAGAAFTDGVDFSFPAGIQLEPAGCLLVIGTTNVDGFAFHYGLSTNILIAGTYSGSLDNGGEELTLKTAPGGTAIVDFEYGVGRHWPLAAAGAGHSLVPLAEEGQAIGALDNPGNWRASAYVGGSPGTADPVPDTTLMLSEIAAHTDFYDPARPEYDSNDWIELVNRASHAVSLAGCWLSDDPAEPAKWACPPVSIPAGGRLVFTEVDDFHNPITSGFGLDKAGEQLLLSYLPGTAADRVLDAVGFDGQENFRTLSRQGGYWQAAEPSGGSANRPPLPGLRISEFMFHPAPIGTNDNLRDEYVELFNPTGSNVLMQTDGIAWRIGGGIDYTFPAATALAAGESLLVVSFDPADAAASNAFAAAYGLAGPVRMLGPWSGRLGNRSESIVLERPQAPDFVGDSYSWVVEDETVYGNTLPWPVAAGNGLALHRLIFLASGLDPANWIAAPPEPDSAGDSPHADQDGDGASDHDEDVAGTDPYDPDSLFRIENVDGASFSWPSVAGRRYSVYWTDDLRNPFIPVATNLAYPQGSYTDPAHAEDPAGFYRMEVVAPGAP